MRTAGVILDIYDDPKGLVLRDKLAGAAIPQKLATAQLLDHEKLAQLPDRLFALVGTDHGSVIRKYAMHDEPHLVTSIIYFMEGGHLFPEDVQVKVAANLVNACAWYGMDPPEGLVKVALGAMGALTLGMGAMDLNNKAKEGTERKRSVMDDFRRAQTEGLKTAAGTTVELSMAEDRAIQAGRDTPGHVAKALAKRDRAAMNRSSTSAEEMCEGKRADLNGTELMPHGALPSKSIHSSPYKRVPLPAKHASARLAAHLIPEGWAHVGDLTHAEPPQVVKQASYQHFALPHLGRYPIDTPALLEKAAEYFDEHLSEFPLLERRVYAQSVHLRAQELGTKVAGAVTRYAGDEYGPQIAAELLVRERSFEGTGHEAVYEALREKIAEIDPRVMVELLKEADAVTGADHGYGRPATGFMDPYQAVYGGAKTASGAGTFSWAQDTDHVTESQLKALAARPGALKGAFDSHIEESFRKDPVGIFSSLPDPSKVVIARLASDYNGE
jgi:hypothetical protein